MSDSTITNKQHQEIMDKLTELCDQIAALTIQPPVPVIEHPKISKSYTCDLCEKDTYTDAKGNIKRLTRRSRLQDCKHGFCRPCLIEHFNTVDNTECPIEGCPGYMPESKLEELKNPGAKGRRIAQEKRKMAEEKSSDHEPEQKVVKVPVKKAKAKVTKVTTVTEEVTEEVPEHPDSEKEATEGHETSDEELNELAEQIQFDF